MTAPEPYWADDRVTLHLGDCLDILPSLEADSVDAVVTDPPAGIAFMGREWDDFRRARNPADVGRDDVFGRTSARGPEYGRGERRAFVEWLTAVMAEAMRVMKPGAHALVWSIPRTSHWTAWAIEDAGLEIRDCITHLFGSGFPKSLNVAKAIDGHLTKGRSDSLALADVNAERPGDATVRPTSQNGWKGFVGGENEGPREKRATPATQEAARWDGWGTALKPGQELWWLARKPFRRTAAANVLAYGTGALNINGCLVAHADAADLAQSRAKNPGRTDTATTDVYGADRPQQSVNDAGRWPTNILFTHSAACIQTGTRLMAGDSRAGQEPGTRPGGFADIGAERGSERPNGTLHGTEAVPVFQCAADCPVGELDRQSGRLASGARIAGDRRSDSVNWRFRGGTSEASAGGASRFYPVFRYQAKAPAHERPRLPDGTAHETVKSLDLMRWLVRLITPPGGLVLDLFAGSGTTGEACIIEGFRCVLIEKNPASVQLIRTRLRKPIQPDIFGGVA